LLSSTALELGAQDFLSKKDLTAETLDRVIRNAIVRFRPVQERESALAEREHLLRLAQEVAGIGTFELNLANGKTRFGGCYFQLYGLPSDHPGFSFPEWLDRSPPRRPHDNPGGDSAGNCGGRGFQL